MDKELEVVENGLVPVYETSIGEKVVYGTELHSVLQVKSRFNDWIRNRLKDCDAVENEDFQTFTKNLVGDGRPQKEYIIKLDTAKEMAMLERNEKGKQVRRYFIQVEKKYKAQMAENRVSAELEKKLLEFIGQQTRFMQNQKEFNDATSRKLESLEKREVAGLSENLLVIQKDVLDERIKTLNSLIDQVALLHGMDRNRLLHFMYKTLQEHFGISLNPYLSVMKLESGDNSLCNLHVIASNNRFYKAAIDMNQFEIDRKKIYG